MLWLYQVLLESVWDRDAAERASEFINQIQPNSKLYIGCSAALNQSRMAIGQLIAAVLSGGALGLFKLP